MITLPDYIKYITNRNAAIEEYHETTFNKMDFEKYQKSATNIEFNFCLFLRMNGKITLLE